MVSGTIKDQELGVEGKNFVPGVRGKKEDQPGMLQGPREWGLVGSWCDSGIPGHSPWCWLALVTLIRSASRCEAQAERPPPVPSL